jgi:hypothetical protein
MGQSLVKKVRDRETIWGKRQREDSGIDIGLGNSGQRADPSTSEFQDITRTKSDDMAALPARPVNGVKNVQVVDIPFGGIA